MSHSGRRIYWNLAAWALLCGGWLAACGSPTAAAPLLQAGGLRIGDVVQTTFEGRSLESALIDVHEGTGYIEVVSENSSLVLGLPLEAFQLVRRGSSPAKFPDAKARKPKTAATTGPLVRRWTDQSGKFSVEGSLVGVANGVVYLKATDGRELKIPLERLSPADQQLARTPAASPDGSPFVALGIDRESPPPAAETPLAETPAPNAGASGMSPASRALAAAATGDSANDTQLPIPVVVLTAPRKAPGSAKELKPAKAEAPFEPDRLAASPQPPRRLRLGAMLRFQPSGVPNRTGTHFAVSSYDMDKARLHVYSLDQPDSYAAVDIGFDDANRLDRAISVGALSPGGTRLLTFTRGRIDLWRCSLELIEHLGGWEAGLTWAEFIDEQRLLVVSEGSIYCLDCNPVKIAWAYPQASQTNPGLSPNGRYAAIISGLKLKVIDLQQSQEYAELEPGFTGNWRAIPTCAAFSPNGENLALCCDGAVEVWDLATRQRIRQITVPSSKNSSVQWVGDDLLLCGLRYFVDVPQNQVVWQLGPCRLTHPRAIGFDHMWFWSGEEYAWRLDLPPAELRRRLAVTSATPAAELKLKPGSAVAIDLDLNFSEKALRMIQDSYRAQIEKNRWTESARPEYVIRAFVQQMEPETRVFHREVLPFLTQPVANITFRPTTSVVEIVDRTDGDRVIWRQEQLNHPDRSTPVLRANFTPQQAVDETCQPRTNFFTDVMLPTSLSPAATVQAQTGRTVVGAFGPDDSR